VAAHSPTAGTQPPERCDIAVVGAGIIGLAVARELTRRRPGASVCVLEREPRVAQHQTGHSSGVIHAGIYYRPGSLKAQLCVEGALALREYCAQHGLAVERCGKVILASGSRELPRLEELERRGRANGVAGLRRIGPSELAEIEPHARGVAALHSPNTAIVNFTAVAEALAGDVRAGGGQVITGCEVRQVRSETRSLLLRLAGGELRARHAVFCAGAWADRLAVAAGASADPRIVPFRGAYHSLPATHRHLVRALIYPVPDPSLPFLGVHLSRHIDGAVLVGPTALLAGARDAYSLARLRRADLVETLSWPGTWRMLRRWWPTAVHELRAAVSPSLLARAAARYVPALQGVTLRFAGAGVRAQALARDGRLLDDFHISLTARALHLRNAPSPAATAALAIARHVVDRADAAFFQ
jgi:(S)-2-hydroxyglutarate dehydrogenase